MTMPAQPPPLPGGSPPRRMAVLANLVVPGLGQVLQRRWGAGLLFLAMALVSLGLCGWGFVVFVRQYVWLLRELLEDREVEALAAPWEALSMVGLGLAGLVLSYVWSLYDAHRAANRVSTTPGAP